MNQNQNQAQMNGQYGAHELIGMNEALMTKAANVELLSFLSHQVQDPQLQNMLQQQAQTIYENYLQGVSMLQGHSGGMQSMSMNAQPPMMSAQPKLGLRQPSMPAPSMQGGAPSERAICTIVLNLHKFGAVSWTTLALECANPQLRTFLMNGAHMCDRMAYDVWSIMNQKGFYQVPTLQQNTTQTMIQQYQVPPNAQAMQGSNPFPYLQ